jgi:hypothetical protein
MWNASRMCAYGWLPIAALALGVGGGGGCNKRSLPGDGTGTLDGGPVGAAGSNGPGVGGQGAPGVAGAGGQGTTGVGGAAGIAAACTGPSDDRLVLAKQRVFRLTEAELLNTVRYLINDDEAGALVRDAIVGAEGDESRRLFPPLRGSLSTNIDVNTFTFLDPVANHVADYVLANFTALAACPTASDACATTYLDKLARKAYRRQLTAEEQARFSGLYQRLRSPQTVNGYLVTFAIEEAVSYAVRALLTSPQMHWRWEIGDPAIASTSPAGVPLTEAELATHLAFFLTDQPPDDTLIAAASAGTLRANLPAHVDRLLASAASRDWLRTIIETYLRLNRLSQSSVDTTKFPVFTPTIASDMRVEARKFLDNVLWNGNLTDLLLSRTSFLNSNLAADIYRVPTPPGATQSIFVQASLPPEQRAGLLTNAGFLTANAGFAGHGYSQLVPRGLLVATVLLCMPHPGPDMPGSIDFPRFAMQTGQEQVAIRAGQPACNACHGQFDPYGLALENYDAIGRHRTIDDLDRPVDAHAFLPAALDGDRVANGVELAQKLATKPAFTNCMARTLLEYAMADGSAAVEVPLLPRQAGCATADVAQRYASAGGKTFTDLVRATAAAPAFALRRAAP